MGKREKPDKTLPGSWAKDLTGHRFGMLVVVAFHDRDKRYYNCKIRWTTKCDCGNEKIVSGNALQSRGIRSCGCMPRRPRTESQKTLERRKLTVERKSEYRIWAGMISRCERPKNRGFKYYGGRGIRVDPRWRNSFDAFYESMGPRPSSEHSIDRIDNNGNYEPGNCRWATRKQQARNKRTNHMVEVDGRVGTVTDMAIEAGKNPPSVFSRIGRGWDPASAIKDPPMTPEQKAARRRKLPGETNPASKLTDDDVRKIRDAYSPNKIGKWRLAKAFGVSKNAIALILSGKTWTHVV